MTIRNSWLYAATGRHLAHYDFDVESFTLEKRSTVSFPAKVQYAWPHAAEKYLYVATSDRAKPNPGTEHHLTAMRVDPQSGELSFHGPSVRLPNRPVHITTDAASSFLLVAYNEPSDLEVYGVNNDGTVGNLVPQQAKDVGVYGHQVRVTPDNQLAILVTRGNAGSSVLPHGVRQKDPGALKVFSYHQGVLGTEISIAPADGYAFGPRHLDFHPTAPWVFVSLETQNKLLVFKRSGGKILPEPLFERDTLPHDAQFTRRQQAGTVHVHPSGKFVYCVNRGNAPVQHEGRRVLIDPINSFAVFAVDEPTGEPTLLQHIDTAGICARTFSIDPGGRMLVAANSESHWVKYGDELRKVPPNLAVFEIRSDGTLRFVRKYDWEADSTDTLFWMGMPGWR